MSKIEDLVNSEGFVRFRKFCVTYSCVAIAAALVVKYVLGNIELGTDLLIIGMGPLAIFAFLHAYRKPKNRFRADVAATDENGQEVFESAYPDMTKAQMFFTSDAVANFICKLDGWGAAVGIIGLLFWLNHWPGSKNMLVIAVPVLLLTGILHLTRHLLTRDLRPIE